MTELLPTEQIPEMFRHLLSWLVASGVFLVRVTAVLVAAALSGWAAGLVTRFLLRRCDGWADRIGVHGALNRFGIARTLSHVLGRTVFLLVALLVAQITADAVGVPVIASGIGSVLGYAPRILVAGVILLAGVAAAGHLRRAATQAARDAGIEYASTLGTLVFAALAFAAGLLAINQLLIATDAVWLLLGWFLAGLTLALGLSFGLGARDLAHDILAGSYARRLFPIGGEIEVQGERGVLISITPTNALIEQEDAIVSVSNSRLIKEVVRRSKEASSVGP